MSRRPSFSNEQIIDAARTLFLDQGLSVSTAAIAKAAGVSEGTLFKRFPSKNVLFEAAMGLPECRLDLELEALVGQGDLHDNLVTLSIGIVDFFRKVLPRMMLMWSHPSFNPIEFLKSHPDPPPLRTLRRLTRYVEAEMALGRLRHCDAETVARVLLGSVHNFVFGELTGTQVSQPPTPEAYAAQLVDILWAGIAP